MAVNLIDKIRLSYYKHLISLGGKAYLTPYYISFLPLKITRVTLSNLRYSLFNLQAAYVKTIVSFKPLDET